LVFFTVTNSDFTRSHHGILRQNPRQTDNIEDSRDAELSTFALREAPSLTKPEVYDICTGDKETVFIHLRRVGGTTMLRFLKRGIQKHMCPKYHNIHHVETYVRTFGQHESWCLEKEFFSKDPLTRPLLIINLRDPLDRMWSLYSLENRYYGKVGFKNTDLPNSSSPIWDKPPEKYFTEFPDNFYVRVLCCSNNEGRLLEEKIGLSHLSRAKKVLEHEIGIIAIMEWFWDPRFTHYLHSTLNTRRVLPFGCFHKSFDMAEGQRELLGKIRFTDPAFEETWKRKNSLDFELYDFARRLSWSRIKLFWNVSNGDLLPLAREPPVSNYGEWKGEALNRQCV